MVKPPKKPGYSEREVKVILEDIDSQFRVFGEGMEQVNCRLDKIDGRLDQIDGRLTRVETDVSMIKIVLKSVATKDDLLVIDRRLTALEAR